jgi:CDGSH-type Zn-finger protein/uncharacterized Fe-S cluster protein YjdI
MTTATPDSGIEHAAGKQIDITFNGKRCIHSRNCVLGLPQVFKANVQGPWIDPDAASVESLVGVAHACPSGAIQYTRKDGGPQETAPLVNLVQLRENGPLGIRAPVTVNGAAAGFRVTLCRCGASNTKPFCDGSHAAAGFTATGEVATRPTEPLTERAGPLAIQTIKNGPLKASGPMEVISGTGRTIDRTKEAWLCRCGASKNKPYCDGSHKAIGFAAD